MHEQAAGLVEPLAQVMRRGDSGTTVIFIAHGLGGLIAEKARTLAYEKVELQHKDFDLMRLGSPYFGSKEPSDEDLALVSRFSVVLGDKVTDPLATYNLWHGIQHDVTDKFQQPLGNGTSTFVASFYETESLDVNPNPVGSPRVVTRDCVPAVLYCTDIIPASAHGEIAIQWEDEVWTRYGYVAAQIRTASVRDSGQP